MRFDFNEANILKQNLFMSNDTKETVVHRLVDLSKTTNDQVLKCSVESLIQKIETLSETQLKNIRNDIAKKRMIATANFDYGDK